MKLGSRTRPPLSSTGSSGSALRPVLLATFDVPVATEAAELAVGAAVETGQPLIVVNLIGGSFYPSVAAPLLSPVVRPDVEESLRAPAELAASLGVMAERLRILSPRPIDALVELVGERRPGLLVLGARPDRLRRRFWARARKRVREHTTCLVWP